MVYTSSMKTLNGQNTTLFKFDQQVLLLWYFLPSKSEEFIFKLLPKYIKVDKDE